MFKLADINLEKVHFEARKFRRAKIEQLEKKVAEGERLSVTEIAFLLFIKEWVMEKHKEIETRGDAKHQGVITITLEEVGCQKDCKHRLGDGCFYESWRNNNKPCLIFRNWLIKKLKNG